MRNEASGERSARKARALPGSERRRRIVKRLESSQAPLSGDELAQHFGVSRQSLVQDVAILRAAGKEILATPRGYCLSQGPSRAHHAVLACRHEPQQTEEELLILVDNGVKVLDVVVEHPLYGEMRGSLLIESRADVHDFMKQVRASRALLLSSLTGGVHLHTVEASRAEMIARAKTQLRARGFLLNRMAETKMKSGREQLLEQAFFRGESLTLRNPLYARVFRALSDSLLQSDTASRDLTAEALGLHDARASATVLAREPGVIAGIAEFVFLFTSSGAAVSAKTKDGNSAHCGEELLQATGSRSQLLWIERVGLNLLQRMSGIATATRSLQERLRKRCSSTRIIATRKTPWGLLDKRAVHLGGGGTHRLGLWDAILIKNNHLSLMANREDEAAPLAIQRAWISRQDAAFIEIEVRGTSGALAAAKEFCRLQGQASEHCPCILMLDNMTPREVELALQILRRDRLWDHVLIEASGRIDEANVEEYAATGVDAISVGALTHSARALDLSQRIS